MARSPFLMRRGNRWVYNRAYPKDLWSTLGRAPFRKALRTDSISEARRACPEAEREYWARIDEARRRKAAGTGAAPLTNKDAEALAAELFRRGLSEAEELIGRPKSPEALDYAIEAAEDAVADASRRIAEQDFDGRYRETATRLAKEAGYSVQPGATFDCFLRLLARLDRAAAEVYRGRLVGNYGARPGDPFFASLMDAPAAGKGAAPPAPPRTIEDLIEAYAADRFGALSAATRASYAPVFRLLRDVLGDSREVHSIGRAEGRQLFEAIKSLPAALGKRRELRGLNVPAAIIVAKRLSLPGLSPKTINDAYLAPLSALFAWAQREGWLAANPIKGLRVGGDIAAAEKRDPFTLKQLQALFAATPWHPRDVAPDGRAIRYWAPLLALFHGMRRGEIAQLKASDVVVLEGIPVIEVRGRQLKTLAARRTLPVHPELIRLGFLDYAQEQREAGEQMLFSGEVANKRGQWGDPVGDWFARLLRRRGITGRKLGLHSFRHNFEDRLREAGLHGTALGAELAGRSKAGNVAAAYGRGFAIRQLAEAVAKITYPELRIEGPQ